MNVEELEQWKALPVSMWLLDRLDKVQEGCKTVCLSAGQAKTPHEVVQIVTRHEGMYDLIEQIKEMLKEGDYEE